MLVVLCLLTAGSVLLFGHLLFRTLSRSVYENALLDSRRDAEQLAKGLNERTSGNLYTLRFKQTEIENFVGSLVEGRQILTEVAVLDKDKKVVYTYKGAVTQNERPEVPGPEGGFGPPGPSILPNERSSGGEVAITDPFNIEVPIANFGVLRVGLSRKELSARVEKLRKELYVRTFAAAVVSLLGIGAASWAVLLLVKRNRATEEARVEAERRAELGEVAAGLAHEIRNPLNAMGLNLELLEEALQRSAAGVPAGRVKAEELARAAHHESTRLAKLLSDFLAYARPSPLAPVPGDLNGPAQEAVAFLASEAERRHIHLELKPHPGGAPALLDEARVKQVVLNLIANALDAVESEGATAREVVVSVTEDEADANAWRLCVEDRGPGIPHEKARELFKLFVSTKPAGTGLGLPIAERIVKEHGGALTLESPPGEPTRAVATFPKLGISV